MLVVQVSMGNHLSLRLVHNGAFAVISGLCKARMRFLLNSLLIIII